MNILLDCFCNGAREPAPPTQPLLNNGTSYAHYDSPSHKMPFSHSAENPPTTYTKSCLLGLSFPFCRGWV